MQERLTKGLYYNSMGNAETLFGLRFTQIRGVELAHNGGWFNLKGEKIGCGDLDADDIRHIMVGLLPSEAFFVLHEGDSYCDLKRDYPDLDPDAPGLEYVLDKAWLVILHDRALLTRRNWHGQPEETVLGCAGNSVSVTTVERGWMVDELIRLGLVWSPKESNVPQAG